MPTPDERAAGPLQWPATPAFARIVPFAAFMVFVAASSFLPAPLPVAPGEFDSRWLYAARALVVGAILLLVWRRLDELLEPLQAAHWIYALFAGVAVFAIWIVLDHGWMVIGGDTSPGFDPRRFGSEALHIELTVLRLLGLAVVVPIAEELFWRSFLLRWLERPEFLRVAPGAVGLRALLMSSVLFALEHSQWLAGFIAGLAYGWIYMRTGKIWVPILAHALTNGLLGGWILWTADWRFW
jgi:hypothetical protein